MLTVRWLHLVAMALALGGATLIWGLFRHAAVGDIAAGDDATVGGDATVRDDATAGDDATVGDDVAASVAAGYESVFWPAMGVLVMTGVGNLGSLAPYVPESGTYWGTIFAVKLAAVMAVLVCSVVRTLVVWRWRRGDAEAGASARILRFGYAATTVALTGIVALAGVLAHG